MNEETLVALEKLKQGKSISLTKDTNKDLSNTITSLANIGVLYKTPRKQYVLEINNRKHLSKLIELKSWDDFLEWLDKQNTDSKITNDFSGSTIGQVNQSSGNIDLKSPIKQNINNNTDKIPKTKSVLEIVSWVIGIIAAGIAIYEFIIKRFIA